MVDSFEILQGLSPDLGIFIGQSCQRERDVGGTTHGVVERRPVSQPKYELRIRHQHSLVELRTIGHTLKVLRLTPQTGRTLIAMSRPPTAKAPVAPCGEAQLACAHQTRQRRQIRAPDLGEPDGRQEGTADGSARWRCVLGHQPIGLLKAMIGYFHVRRTPCDA